jgi:hypothetical protein
MGQIAVYRRIDVHRGVRANSVGPELLAYRATGGETQSNRNGDENSLQEVFDRHRMARILADEEPKGQVPGSGSGGVSPKIAGN